MHEGDGGICAHAPCTVHARLYALHHITMPLSLSLYQAHYNDSCENGPYRVKDLSCRR